MARLAVREARGTGRSETPPRLAAALVRRRMVGIVVVVAVVVAMLVVPKVASTASAPAGSGITYLPGQTHMNAPYSHGVAVSGVTCGPGVRQVPWSAYAPPCEPKWTGNNGGATAPGVTATTITLSFRAATSAILQALYTIVPKSVIGTSKEAEETLQAYINVFNKDFELYGRHVVLASYVGQGNFINEDVGTGAAQAEADAVNVATSLHAFADMSLVGSSVPYTEDLQANKVISFGLYLQDQQWYQQNAPWQYTPGPNCTKSARAIGELFGRQLKGTTAEFAKGALRGKVRKLGIIYQNTPTATACEQQMVQDLAAYGVHPAATAAVTFNVSKLADESASTIAEMKKQGVTTVICSSCDPVSPQFYLSAANQDNYHPEWFIQSLFGTGATTSEKFIRLFPANQRSQILTYGSAPTPTAQAEALKVFKMGNTDPTATIIPSYVFVYASVLQFFDALQLAGPNLTPHNLEAAMRAIPTSLPGGELGGWSGSAGPFDPASTFQVLHWNNHEPSQADGRLGTYDVCDNGTAYSFTGGGPQMPAHTQLTCEPGISRAQLGAASPGGTGGAAGTAAALGAVRREAGGRVR